MVATDNVKPMLITECGALNIGGSDADYWLPRLPAVGILWEF